MARRLLQQKQERQAEQARAKVLKKAPKGLFDGWTVGEALGVDLDADLSERTQGSDASAFLTNLGL